MNILSAVTLIASLLLFTNFADARDLVLYGIASESCGNPDSGSGEGSLYIVNPDTGAMELIGPTGFDGVTGLAFLDDGRLLASARQGQDRSILLEINSQTGQGTLIGVIGDRNFPGQCGRVSDLTYDSPSKTLYGTGNSCNDPRVLLEIDPLTAQPTVIGAIGFSGGGFALAIREDGTLFGSTTLGSDVSIFTINRDTGLGSLVGEMDTSGIITGGVVVNGLAFHPLSQELFASSVNEGVGNTSSFLLTIDESVPDFSVVGQTLDCFDGIVFAIVPAPIPALSTWGIIALVLVIAIAGAFYVRKKQVRA